MTASDLVRARIHSLIAERGWTKQRILADRAHRTQAWASRILRPGHLRCLKILDQIAATFEIDVRTVLDASAATPPFPDPHAIAPAPAPRRTPLRRPPAEDLVMSTLRLERLRRGLSLRALGRLVRVPPSDLSQIERGLLRPYPDQARRLAGALKLRIADLLAPAPPLRRVSRDPARSGRRP